MLSGNIRTFVRPRRHFQPKQKATNGTVMSLDSMEYFFFLPVAFALYWAVPARKNTLRNALLGLFRHRCRYGKTVRTADAPQLCLSQQSDLSSTVPPHQVRRRREHTKNNQAVEIAVVMFLQRQRSCLRVGETPNTTEITTETSTDTTESTTETSANTTETATETATEKSCCTNRNEYKIKG